jgi:dolichol kinase
MNDNNEIKENNISQEQIPDSPKKKKKKKRKNISLENEFLRKGIHLMSLAIPIAYIFFPRDIALMILLPMTFIAVVTDTVTRFSDKAREIYLKYFGKMLRKHELSRKKFRLNGASWVLISASLMVLLFPKIITVTSFTILIISDMSAALVGRIYGRNKFFDKSVEGSTAFFVTAVIAVLAYSYAFTAPASFLVTGIIAAAGGTIAEAASKKIRMDDNFSIPISTGLIFLAGDFIASAFSDGFSQIL